MNTGVDTVFGGGRSVCLALSIALGAALLCGVCYAQELMIEDDSPIAFPGVQEEAQPADTKPPEVDLVEQPMPQMTEAEMPAETKPMTSAQSLENVETQAEMPETLPKQGDLPAVKPPMATQKVGLAGVIQTGWMGNLPDGKFHADMPVDRSTLAAVLVQAFKLEKRPPLYDSAGEVMQDVPTDHWARPAIEVAVKSGLMQGHKDGKFYPARKITRAEGFAVFAQAFGIYPFQRETVDQLLGQYTDGKQVPVWARNGVATAASEGFINLNKNAIEPEAPMTRGDLAHALGWWLARQQRVSPPKGL